VSDKSSAGFLLGHLWASPLHCVYSLSDQTRKFSWSSLGEAERDALQLTETESFKFTPIPGNYYYPPHPPRPSRALLDQLFSPCQSCSFTLSTTSLSPPYTLSELLPTLVRSPAFSNSPEMAPITDDKVEELRTQYHALEERIHRLEQRLETGEAKPTVAESMRLILIGPPGAGPFPATKTREITRLLIDLVQEREHKLQRSRTSTASAIWYDLIPRSLFGPLLILGAVGHGRYATSTSCQKDSLGKRS
jgi:hypothetical protein